MSLGRLELGIQKNSSLNGPVECGITIPEDNDENYDDLMMTLIAFQILYSVKFSHTHDTEDYNS